MKKPAPKAEKKPKVEMELGPLPVSQGVEFDRICMLLWGLSGCGKSTWAATAPGDKLWISIGDGEHRSVAKRKDVFVADASKLGTDELFAQLQSDNPLSLGTLLEKNTNIESVVFDSATALAFRALQKSVNDGIGGSRNFTPTMAFPGQSAYGGRNGIVLECLTGLMRVTAQYGVHLIVTAHEGDPKLVKGKEAEGLIDYIGVMLGGQLVSNMSLRMSEIWHMRQSALKDQERTVSIRPNGNRKPMKTRMFRGDQEPSFMLKYNSFKPDKGQMTIADFWYDWLEGKGEHLNVPGHKG